MLELTIIIPCFNEAKRLPKDQYRSFISQTDSIKLLFVDDGSTDNTATVLSELQKEFPDKIELLLADTNKGKAEAIRLGMQYFKAVECKKVAYLDADLATDLKECVRLSKDVSEKLPFVFGSRILKIDNHIERKWYRFVIGRVIATVISTMLQLKVYDTQCGCKIFTSSLAKKLFATSFISQWLFDVELFFRMIQLVGRANIHQSVKEVPLSRWIDTEDSKVKLSYGFYLWIDLFKIYKHYR